MHTQFSRSVGTRRLITSLIACLTLGLTFLSCAVLPAQVAGAAMLKVTNCNDSGPGSLRAQVAAAAPGDTIKLGSSCPLITLSSGYINIDTNLTITGPGATSLAVSGNNASEVFFLGGSNVTISGITVQNGDPAGIINFGSLTVKNATVTDNTGPGIANALDLNVKDSTLSNNASDIPNFPINGGGAIDNGGIGNSTATVTDSKLINNTGNDGGGAIYNGYKVGFGNSTLTVTDSTLSGNSAPNGGAIYNQIGSIVTVNNTNLSDNTTTNLQPYACGGGGIYNAGTLTATHSTLFGNSDSGSLTEGGGICNAAGGTLTIKGNTTLSNNSTTDPISGGGGIYNAGAMTVERSTLLDNSAGLVGGGILNDTGGTATVTASTLSNNRAPSGGAIYNGCLVSVDGAGGVVTVTRGTFSNNTDSSTDVDPGIFNDPDCHPIGTLTVSHNTTF
jgi:hypothetical protein